MRRTCLIALALSAGVLADTALVAQEPVELYGASWDLRGEGTKVEEHLGRQAIRMRNGTAVLQDVEFENGTIEFDVATSGQRSFIGVVFRAQENGSFEDFYLRPHQSDRFDALQYTPVWHGASAWQLYPEFNAPTGIPREEWIHVRLEIAGSRLRAFLNESVTPALEVERMRGPQGPGPIAVRGFFPQAGELNIYPTAFSNIVVRTAVGTVAYLEDRGPEASSGLVKEWAISQPYPAPAEVIESPPVDLLEKAEWKLAGADQTGRLNLARYGGIPEGSNNGTILVRARIRSDTARQEKLNFGFSDRVSIFLNGELLFTGNNTYRSRSLRYLGVMTVENDALILPLKDGDNELLAVVTESFGGWGWTAKLAPSSNVDITAPLD